MTTFRFTDSHPESKDKSQDPKEKKGGWGATIGNILVIAAVCGVFYWVINSSTSSPSSPDDDFPDDSGGGDSGDNDHNDETLPILDMGCDCAHGGSRLQDNTDYSHNDFPNANGVLVDNINVCVNNCIEDEHCVRISYAPDVTSTKGRCFKKKSPSSSDKLNKVYPTATAGPEWRQSVNVREDDDGNPLSFTGMYCDVGPWYGRLATDGNGAYVDAGFCCDYTKDCDYVDECRAYKGRDDCVNSYCTWHTPDPNAGPDAKGSCSWSWDGCSTDPRCCFNRNKPSECGRRGAPPLGSAHKGTQCNPGCSLVKGGETTPDGGKAFAWDVCISTDRTTAPETKYQGGKFPKQFLSKVCKL